MRDSFVVPSYHSCSAKLKNERISNLADSLLTQPKRFIFIKKEGGIPSLTLLYPSLRA